MVYSEFCAIVFDMLAEPSPEGKNLPVPHVAQAVPDARSRHLKLAELYVGLQWWFMK